MATETPAPSIKFTGRHCEMFLLLKQDHDKKHPRSSNQSMAEWLVEEEFKRRFPKINPVTLVPVGD